MKKLTLSLLLLNFYAFSFGQNYKSIRIIDTVAYTNYKLAIRMMPISLIDIIQPSVTVGAEYKINQRNAVAIDISGLIPYASVNTGLAQNKGFILKPSFRYYFPKKKISQSNTFIEPDFFWKRQFNEKSEWVAVYGSNGNIDYNIRKDFTELKEVVGGNIKIGIQQKLFTDNFFIEVYAGVGIRTGIKKVWNSDNSFKPSETTNTFFDDHLKYNERFKTYSITGGIRLVLAIKY
jgi:hypothetical protein